jgi:hypothetical protein
MLAKPFDYNGNAQQKFNLQVGGEPCVSGDCFGVDRELPVLLPLVDLKFVDQVIPMTVSPLSFSGFPKRLICALFVVLVETRLLCCGATTVESVITIFVWTTH